MQFSLRRLLLIVTSIAVILAVGLMLTLRWRRQLEIQNDLTLQGAAWVGFDQQQLELVPNVLYTRPLVESIKHHETLGVVELKGFDVTPQCIQRLSKLKQIDNLYLISCAVCDDDLVHLPQMNITNLLFWNAAVTDQSVEAIAQIRGLKKVSFKNTAISPQGAAKLQSILPEVEIVLLP
jgi:hypothetical protein